MGKYDDDNRFSEAAQNGNGGNAQQEEFVITTFNPK